MMAGVLQGLVSGVEQVVFDQKVTGSSTSSITTGNILNGDEDGWYTIIIRHIASGTSLASLQFNGDTTVGNYGRRGIEATNTTVGDWAATSESYLGYGASAGYTSLAVVRLYAKSGAVRVFNYAMTWSINGTAIERVNSGGMVWNNTADNIISMQLVGGLDVGTRLIVLKSNNFTNGTPTGTITTPKITGAWTRVGSQVLGSAATSVTFSGLAGDVAVLYMLSASVKNGYNGACQSTLTFNSDTTQGNYGFQRFYATNTTIAGDRYTNASSEITNISTQNYIGMATALIYAESGYIRPYLVSGVRSINGTTVTLLLNNGCVWNNTGDVVTQLVLTSDQANGFGIGSQFDLFALYT